LLEPLFKNSKLLLKKVDFLFEMFGYNNLYYYPYNKLNLILKHYDVSCRSCI
jgi:hypothetical protein